MELSRAGLNGIDIADSSDQDRAALEAGKGFVRNCKTVVDSISTLEWKTAMGFWTLLCRCVVRRQYDSLQNIVDSVERGQGHSTVPLLRPACEEYLWIKYLRAVDEESRERIILAKSQLEVAGTLENQSLFMSPDGMAKLGFQPDFLKRMIAGRTRSEQEMKAVGKKLRWRLKKGLFPSVAAVARMVNEERIYRTIYSARGCPKFR